MAECPNRSRFAWCKGPGSFGVGQQCQDCRKASPPAGPLGPITKTTPTPPNPPQRPIGPLSNGTPVVTTTAATGAAAPYTFYRAVRSGPATYLERGGFQPRVQIGLSQIKLLMKNLFERADHAVDIPTRAVILHEAYKKRRDWIALDLVREIKKEKSDSTCQLSTDLTPDCGGYAKGNYVFKIEYQNLTLDKLVNRSLAAWNPRVKPKLVMNRATIDTSDVFAFACGGDEVAFLTDIPLTSIREYQRKDETVWRKLWSDDGTSLWEAEAEATRAKDTKRAG
jgi:hypothetical protein